GAFSNTGEADGPPMRPGPTKGDAGTGVQMARNISAAYVQNLNTGKGQLIELSMQEAMTYYLRTSTSRCNYGETAALRNGNGKLPNMSLYPCKGGGPNDYVFIMAVTPRMWEALTEVIGRPEFAADERFKHNRSRLKNTDLLMPEIEKWTMQYDKYEAMTLLSEGGVPASAVLSTKDIYDNPHVNERGFVHEVEHPVVGPIKLWGWPGKLSESEVAIVAAPVLGQHSAEVLAQDLDMSDGDIAALIESGAIEVAKPF
ncbi:MAG: CoA transferase, partial [Gammaproteobacteria bacterium]|nr:CoA transferase [Gammaproteobacteria bacterium]